MQHASIILYNMRLLHTSSLRVEDFDEPVHRKYAILSHTWGQDEVSFAQMARLRHPTTSKAGFKKIKSFCDIARRHGYEHVWVDTCCIDKRNSAELSEAINSMYRYYREADECYIYLIDVQPTSDRIELLARINNSEWNSRGWTLQELLASNKRRFLACDWSGIADHKDLIETISARTRIDQRVLEDRRLVPTVCLAERMSWVSRRQTRRPEDLAYCLLGIFNISIPILYGEGLDKAFRRLQMEIMQTSFDQTLFAWMGPYVGSGLLANSPRDFQNTPRLRLWSPTSLTPYSMTNIGLTIRVLDVTNKVPEKKSSDGSFLASIHCEGRSDGAWKGLAVYLQPVSGINIDITGIGSRRRACRRVKCEEWYWVDSKVLRNAPFEDIVVLQDEHYRLAQQTFQIAQLEESNVEMRMVG